MDFEEFLKKYQKKEVREYPHKIPPAPLLSVMVQTYQHKNFIEDCLDSILSQQTQFHFEILIGEDGSTDGTRQICMEYAEEYPDKIRLFLHHPENKIKVLDYTTGNFNAFYNFFAANGKYIAFCEGDDLWTDPLKLQKQVDLLETNNEHIFNFHSFTEVDKEKRPIPARVTLTQPTHDIISENLKRLVFHPLLSTVCFRNSFKDKIPQGMAEVINVDSFLISLMGNFGSAGFLDNIAPSLYRRHLGGIWGEKDLKQKLIIKLSTYQNLIQHYKSTGDQNIASYFSKEFRRHQKMLIFKSIRSFDLKLVLAETKKIFKLY